MAKGSKTPLKPLEAKECPACGKPTLEYRYQNGELKEIVCVNSSCAHYWGME